MGTHSSVLAWRITGMVEPDGLQKHNHCKKQVRKQYPMPFAILMLLTTDRDGCITDMTVSGDHRLTCPRQALCCETGIYGIITHTCELSRFSRVRFYVTPWTVARQTLLSVVFSRREY